MIKSFSGQVIFCFAFLRAISAYVRENRLSQYIENLQRRATKIVPEIKDLSYEERLRELNLPTLEYRRRREDLIQMFKILHGIDDIDSSKFVTLNENTTRGQANLRNIFVSPYPTLFNQYGSVGRKIILFYFPNWIPIKLNCK